MEEYILHKGTAVMKIPLSKIYYVTMHPIKSHTAVFVTIDGEFEKAITLSKLEELSTGGLIRCHRKFLVTKPEQLCSRIRELVILIVQGDVLLF